MENNKNNLNSKNNNSLLVTESGKDQKEQKPIPKHPIVEPTKEPEGLSEEKIEEEMENTTNPLNNRDRIDEDTNLSDKSIKRGNQKDRADDEENTNSDHKTKNNPPIINEENIAESKKEENSNIKLDFSKGRL
jgi:hypothetical protein